MPSPFVLTIVNTKAATKTPAGLTRFYSIQPHPTPIGIHHRSSRLISKENRQSPSGSSRCHYPYGSRRLRGQPLFKTTPRDPAGKIGSMAFGYIVFLCKDLWVLDQVFVVLLKYLSRCLNIKYSKVINLRPWVILLRFVFLFIGSSIQMTSFCLSFCRL